MKKYKVALIADNHFYKTTLNEYYVNGTYSESYLKRFTSSFDCLVVVARVVNASTDDINNLRKSGGERVNFFDLDDFNGVCQYLKKKNKLKRDLIKAFSDVDAVFIRMPCILTTLSLKCAKRLGKPIMLDVGADPDTIYRSFKATFFEKVLSKYMKRVCKKACIEANGVSYVTKSTLQKKYPCRAIIENESINFFTESISNVDIVESFFYKDRHYDSYKLKERTNILHISNYITLNSSKGHLETISILKALLNKGVNAYLTFVGDGDGIEELQKIIFINNLEDRVSFLGRITSRDDYRNVLLKNDIFVFPSHSEGLPRVVLEAMSTGMVCVTSNVDGIPEIVNQKNVFDYNDIEGFANRIVELINDTNEMNVLSRNGYAVASTYSSVIIKNTFDDYCLKIKKMIDNRR